MKARQSMPVNVLSNRHLGLSGVNVAKYRKPGVSGTFWVEMGGIEP
jgi:hypothetical protein